MIILIKNKVDWELIHQRKQTQKIKIISENNKIVDHDYKVGDKFILTNNAEYKYETPSNEPFGITQCWTNDTFTLQCGAIQIRHNMHQINPYTSDTNVEEITT